MADHRQGKNRAIHPEKELLVHTVDRLARECPDALFAEFPISHNSYDNGFHRVSYGVLANAINALAWWFEETFGRGKSFETLAYIGPNDLRYTASVLGAARVGFVASSRRMLLVSPHNSVAAQTNLFKSLKCRTLLTGESRLSLASVNLDTLGLRVVEFPCVDDLLSRKHAVYPFEKSWDEARSDPLVALHTSGSTGLPKPIVWTNDFASSFMQHTSLDPPSGSESQDRMYQDKRVFLTFPPYNGAYIVIHLFNAITRGTVIISTISTTVPILQGLTTGLRKTNADIAFVAPSIVQALAREPRELDFVCQNLKMLIYCGGDVPEAFGNIVASRISLMNQYGTSEMGFVSSVRSSNMNEHWRYVHFHPEIGAELRPHNEVMSELVIVRDPKCEVHQPVFKFFPKTQEYPSRDLWIRHPSQPNLWRMYGRLDDILVLASGQKVYPIPMEQGILTCHSDVSAVLMAGVGRSRSALLIEMADVRSRTAHEQIALLERLWSTINNVNQDYPTFAQVLKSHVLFTDPNKPILRAGKGTVQRQLTIQLYQKEFDHFYTIVESTSRNGESLFMG